MRNHLIRLRSTQHIPITLKPRVSKLWDGGWSEDDNDISQSILDIYQDDDKYQQEAISKPRQPTDYDTNENYDTNQEATNDKKSIKRGGKDKEKHLPK